MLSIDDFTVACWEDINDGVGVKGLHCTHNHKQSVGDILLNEKAQPLVVMVHPNNIIIVDLHRLFLVQSLLEYT